jgi:4-hydroxy-tetrahydrodipicolinate synthase
MPTPRHPRGVFVAAITPLNPDYSLDFNAIPPLFSFLSRRGCHGALLFGTTGEGPSFAVNERITWLRLAVQARQEIPGFQLLAGTGTPNMEETIALTHAAFDLGLDGVVVLPPYYFKKIDDDGLFLWFRQVIQKAAPSDGSFFGYHIPAVSGISLSHNLLARLKDAFPNQFAGIKDSTGDPENARLLGARFGKDLVVFTGNDRLFNLALQNQASGCITALANICSPVLRHVWDAFQQGMLNADAQARLDTYRNVMDQYPPAPAFLKAMLAKRHGFSSWSVRPPLLSLSDQVFQQALTTWDTIDHA